MTALYPHSCTRRKSWRAPNNPGTTPAPFGEREDVALQYIPTMGSYTPLQTNQLQQHSTMWMTLSDLPVSDKSQGKHLHKHGNIFTKIKATKI